MLALSCSVLGKPALLLLDEHLSSLDDKFKDEVNQLVLNYVSDTQAIVMMVTHSKALAEGYCSHLAIITDHQLSFQELSKTSL